MKKTTFKGFDKDLRCSDYQYEIGKTYEKKGNKIECCTDTGFHSCENPLDVLRYYSPSYSRFAECEISGKTDQDSDQICSSKITIKKELTLSSLITLGVEYILSKVFFKNSEKYNTDDYSTAVNNGKYSAAVNTGKYNAAVNTGNKSVAINTASYSTAVNTVSYSTAVNTASYSTAVNTGSESTAVNNGDCSAAVNTGSESTAVNNGHKSAAVNTAYYSVAVNNGKYSTAVNNGKYSAAVNNGDYSAAIVEGYESIGIITGYKSKAKGKKGCWLVLTERDDDYVIKNVKSIKIDGEKIKENTWYQLINNKIIEVV